LLSPSLDRLICKATAKRPEERYQSAAEFAAALGEVADALQEQPKRHATRPLATGPRGHPIIRLGRLLLGLLLVSGVGGGAYWWVVRHGLPELPLPGMGSMPPAAPAVNTQESPATSARTSTAEDTSTPGTTATPVANGPPPLSLTSSQGDLPIVAEGAKLKVLLTIGQDAYVYCYYEQHDGRVFRIFPNRFHTDPWLEAGTRLSIPDDSMKFSFTFDRHATVELVHCFALPEPPRKALPQFLLTFDLQPLEGVGIGAIKAAFQEAVGNSLIEKALLIQID
jgi:hypothetical protein